MFLHHLVTFPFWTGFPTFCPSTREQPYYQRHCHQCEEKMWDLPPSARLYILHRPLTEPGDKAKHGRHETYKQGLKYLISTIRFWPYCVITLTAGDTPRVSHSFHSLISNNCLKNLINNSDIHNCSCLSCLFIYIIVNYFRSFHFRKWHTCTHM